MVIPVIDIFAGPGGLGEGFSALRDRSGAPIFRIALSIEKDPIAHKTLLLRNFFRQFGASRVPGDYYAHLQGKIDLQALLSRHPHQADRAKRETICAELGKRPWPEIDQRIKEAIGQARDWVLIGGPPCQAYSLVGRSKMRSEDPEKFAGDERHLLYREYLRIIAVHRPAVFVMENVKGLLSSEFEQKSTITRILGDLKDPNAALPECGAALDPPLRYALHALAGQGGRGGKPEAESPKGFLVRCEEHGVPQARHRIIIVGVRGELDGKLGLIPARKPVNMWRAIKDLPQIRSRISREEDSPGLWASAVKATCDGAEPSHGQIEPGLSEVMCRYADRLAPRRSVGDEYIPWLRRPSWASSWFYDRRLGGVLNHSSRSHIADDLRRYFFIACYGKLHNASPSISDLPPSLSPRHKNLFGKSPGEIVFADRFRVQLADKPATTITSHISKDGHYYIHPDPTQCRSLTVREAARLQTFPDNYFFAGTRTAQYHQVGNAVPPLIAREIARVIARFLARRNGTGRLWTE